MDCFTYSIEVGDLNAQNFERMDVLVDTREFYTTLPASMLRRLGIAPHRYARLSAIGRVNHTPRYSASPHRD